MSHIRKIVKNEDGSTLVEFSLLMALMFLVTFSIVEIGYIMYQFNSAQKSTQVGARIAATRAPVVTGLPDCGSGIDDATAGTDCNKIDPVENPSYSPFSSVTCSSTATAAPCDNVARLAILAEMRKVYPNLQDENLDITFSATGLGYVGRGKPVPAITVTLKNLSYEYIAVGGLLKTFGAGSVDLGTALNFTTTQTTVIAEDIGEGTG